MLVKVELGNKAYDYLQDCLASGSLLVRSLLNLRLDSGMVWSYLPPDLDPSTVGQFEWDLALEAYDIRDKFDDRLTHFIAGHLSRDGKRYVVFQDTSAEPSDPWVMSQLDHYFTFGREVYHFLTSEDQSPTTILDAKNKARSANSRLNIGVLTRLPLGEEIRVGTEISEDHLRLLATNADHIIVEAFDGKADLIWSRN